MTNGNDHHEGHEKHEELGEADPTTCFVSFVVYRNLNTEH